jgi:hypothetical protein
MICRAIWDHKKPSGIPRIMWDYHAMPARAMTENVMETLSWRCARMILDTIGTAIRWHGSGFGGHAMTFHFFFL